MSRRSVASSESCLERTMCCAVMPGEFLEGIGAGKGANMEAMLQ